MVDDRPVLELKTLWFPTQAAGERSFLMNLEFSLNHRGPEDQPSLAEVACSSGSVDQALALLPPIVPRQTRRIMRRLLRPWPQGRYSEAYDRSGGILNLFTPPWGQAQDEVWAGMVAEWQAQSFPDGQAGQAALRALEQRGNTTPHPFFAGLTPAQVMVGGGPREADLSAEFLDRLAQTFERRPFPSEGQALIKTVLLLRGWQCQPQRDGRTIVQIIIAERDELLARRARALAQRASEG
ncbi:MAG: hypothetical protein H8D78_07455 [Chloroflexi bacterium]|nr:hypothetical protein [Chloroflexota bacterium]